MILPTLHGFVRMLPFGEENCYCLQAANVLPISYFKEVMSNANSEYIVAFATGLPLLVFKVAENGRLSTYDGPVPGTPMSVGGVDGEFLFYSPDDLCVRKMRLGKDGGVVKTLEPSKGWLFDACRDGTLVIWSGEQDKFFVGPDFKPMTIVGFNEADNFVTTNCEEIVRYNDGGFYMNREGKRLSGFYDGLAPVRNAAWPVWVGQKGGMTMLMQFAWSDVCQCHPVGENDYVLPGHVVHDARVWGLGAKKRRLE